MFQQILAMLAAQLIIMFRGSKPTTRFKPVAGFEIDRFLGTWYVAAYVPQPFEKKLSSTSSEYSRGEGSKVSVADRGYDRKKGQWHCEDTVASFKEGENVGWLVVDALNPLKKHRKFIHLNEDQTQAIVVGLTMRTVWIVYRDRNLTKADLDALINRADELGFKTSKLVRVDQSESFGANSQAGLKAA